MSDLNKLNLNFFQIVEIVERPENIELFICELCNKNSSTLSIFDTCKHSSCLTCVDNLYDSYLSNNSNIMFICPFCNSKVFDIIYKK